MVKTRPLCAAILMLTTAGMMLRTGSLVGGLSGWADVASRCARSRGEPSSAHCEQRLSDGSPLARSIPCAPAPECGDTWEKRSRQNDPAVEKKTIRISASDQTRSAACRVGMAGWAGEGGGRFGERREYEAPTLPSTPRQLGAARHHTSQPRNGAVRHTPPHLPTQKRQHNNTLTRSKLARCVCQQPS